MKRDRPIGFPVEVAVIIATVLVCVAVASLRLAS
jgi:hypothetical protein